MTTVLLLCAVAPVPGQDGASVTVEAGGSHSRPPVGTIGPAASYLYGGGALQAPVPAGVLFLNARAGLAVEDQAGDWLWGGLGGRWNGRLAGPLLVSLGLFGDGFTVGDPVAYRAVTARVRPEVGLEVGTARVSAYGSGGVGSSSASVSDTVRVGPGGAPIPEVGGTPSTSREVEAKLWSYGGGTEVSAPIGETTARVGVETVETPDGGYRSAGLSLEGPAGSGRWELAFTAWDTPRGTEAAARLGFRLPVGDGGSLRLWGGRRGPDPLLGIRPAVEGGAGMAWTFSTGGEGTSLYRILGRGGAGRRVVEISIRRPGASQVRVLGDFTRWEPVPMERSDGTWTVRLRLRPGTYHFGFRVDGGWVVPEGVPGRVEDEWGRANATLVVPAGDGGEA